MRRVWQWFRRERSPVCPHCMRLYDNALDGYLGTEGSILWRIRMAVDDARRNQSIPDARYRHLERRCQALSMKARNYRKAMHQFMSFQRAEKFIDLVEENEWLKRELATCKAAGKD